MNCETLGAEGLSNLVEAATALATFSLCSRASAISPEQGGRPTFVEPSVRTINPISTPGPTPGVLNITSAGSKPSSGEPSKETFPQLLQSILNDKDVSADVIAWLPNGRAFVILRPDIFMETILPKYMAQDSSRSSPVSPTTISTKYPSFTRKLNRWYVRWCAMWLRSWSYLFRSLLTSHSIALLIQSSSAVSTGVFVKWLVVRKRVHSIMTCSAEINRNYVSKCSVNDHGTVLTGRRHQKRIRAVNQRPLQGVANQSKSVESRFSRKNR